jgi:hypothetical protein
MMQKAGELVVRSAENLRWAIVRRKATVQFEERLEEAMRTTRNVIAEALAQRPNSSLFSRNWIGLP